MRQIKRDSQTGRIIRLHKLVNVVCPCGVKFETSEDRIKDGRGKTCSKACMYKYRSARLKEEHHFWAGDKVSYSGIHHWAKKEFGQPMKCEWCGFETDNKYQMHWANLSGDYERDRDDWARLCAKCHYHFDREGIHG